MSCETSIARPSPSLSDLAREASAMRGGKRLGTVDDVQRNVAPRRAGT
jgi:hypothetical protein